MGKLMRPTVPIADGNEQADTSADSESRGENAPAAPRARRRRVAPSGKTKGYKIQLTEEMHTRAWLTARKRKTSLSAVVMLALERDLPKLVISEVADRTGQERRSEAS
jgi:hypothetical protein